MSRSLKSLMERLNPTSRRTLEAAAGLCLSQTHYEVEIEHWLQRLLDETDSDLRRICDHFELDASRMMRELMRTVDRFKTGNSRNPTLSPALVKTVEEAWLAASLEHNAAKVRSGHVVMALLSDKALARQTKESTPELHKISLETLEAKFHTITDGSPEDEAGSAPVSGGTAPAHRADTTSPNLDKYTEDLTARANAGQIDAIVGRDDEVRQMIDILMRRRQNNPILTGEAGVGKTAVVEGFAVQLAKGDVPPPLQNVCIRALDLALLQAGAGVKGEFENRLRSVIDEVKASPTPIILFIDEAHTLVGAGGAEGQNDAANLLKPALARGELRTVAATTWAEYKKYFEKDPALTRRFQVVKVDEPDEATAIQMMRPVAAKLEAHHQVMILSEAVEDAVTLSSRYLTGRQLPDKSVSVLDTACARVAVSQCAVPASVEDCHRQRGAQELESRMLTREEAYGSDHGARLADLDDKREKCEAALEALTAQWEKEKSLVRQMIGVRSKLAVFVEGTEQTPPDKEVDLKGLRAELSELEATLREVQGDEPLIHPWVDANAVAAIIANWTGVPMGKMLKDELTTVRKLDAILKERVVGQDHGLAAIAQRIRTSKANLDDPGKPIGVFLLVGPSGVGKTETAVALAETLYGGERNLITINMSEFQEKHTVSSLKGAPPGYVGYGEGGVLTEAVRRKPYSVVLLDEIEKAHPDVLKLFYQVFDKGVMDDGQGREINFKNTILLMTSNLGTAQVMEATERGQKRPSMEALVEAIHPALLTHLEPALLGRMVVIPYYPLADEQLTLIVNLKLGKIQRRMQGQQRIAFHWTDSVVKAVVARCTEVDSGARNVDNILSKTLLPEISNEVLARMAEGNAIVSIGVDYAEDAGFTYDIGVEEG